jgi:hypothetical protein
MAAFGCPPRARWPGERLVVGGAVAVNLGEAGRRRTGGRRQCASPPSSLAARRRSESPPDLEQSKTAVLNTLTSASGQRTYDHAIREFVAWYCSEPRLAFNRSVVLR